jgi:hypothetical protein
MKEKLAEGRTILHQSGVKPPRWGPLINKLAAKEAKNTSLVDNPMTHRRDVLTGAWPLLRVARSDLFMRCECQYAKRERDKPRADSGGKYGGGHSVRAFR